MKRPATHQHRTPIVESLGDIAIGGMPLVYRLERIQPPPPTPHRCESSSVFIFHLRFICGLDNRGRVDSCGYQSRRLRCRERQLLRATLLTSGSETTSPICRQRSITCRRFRTMSPPARSPSSTRSASSTPEHHPWAMATPEACVSADDVQPDQIHPQWCRSGD